MLTVGFDSYITLDEADDIVRLVVDDEQIREQWFNLTDDDKARKLRNACYRIEALPLSSHKHTVWQTLQFPRGLTPSVPQAVKNAQALEAVASFDLQSSRRQALRRQGVTSVSVGNASESYSDNSGTSASTSTLVSLDAYDLLKPYLLGSAVMV